MFRHAASEEERWEKNPENKKNFIALLTNGTLEGFQVYEVLQKLYLENDQVVKEFVLEVAEDLGIEPDFAPLNLSEPGWTTGGPQGQIQIVDHSALEDHSFDQTQQAIDDLPETEHPLGPHTGAQNANLQPLVTQLLSIQQMTQALANNPDADVNSAVNLLNQATGLLQGVLQKPGL